MELAGQKEQDVFPIKPNSTFVFTCIPVYLHTCISRNEPNFYPLLYLCALGGKNKRLQNKANLNSPLPGPRPVKEFVTLCRKIAYRLYTAWRVRFLYCPAGWSEIYCPGLFGKDGTIQP